MKPAMKAMMLTAGLGTRLRPVTNSFAKPAVPFLGVPLLYYPLEILKSIGISSLVLNTHHLPEQIAAIGNDIARSGLDVQISHEPGQPLGSGGGIKHAENFLSGSEDILVCNGDEVILPHHAGVFERFVSEHKKHNALATLLVMRYPGVGTQFGGVWTTSDFKIRGFGLTCPVQEKGLEGFHYPGVILLNRKIFAYLPEGESNLLYDAITNAIANGEVVRAVVDDFTWFETGNPKDFLHATGEALRLSLADEKNYAAKTLRKIVEPFWRDHFILKKTDGLLLLKSNSAQIDSTAKLKGFVVCSENISIAANITVENSVLLPGAKLARDTQDELIL